MKITIKHKQLLATAAMLAGVLPAAAQGYSWDADLHHRLAVDFNRTHEEVKAYIRKYIPDVTEAQMKAWEKTGALESRTVDGQKLYFHNAAPNLFRIDATCRKIKEQKDGKTPEGSEEVNRVNVPRIIEACKRSHTHLAQPKRIRVNYSITVKADAVPDGETVRCWLPFPRTDIDRQQDVRLISTNIKPLSRAPMSCAHSALYMEQRARKGQPTVFSETFEFTSYGSWHGLKPEDIKPYDTSTALYRQYTSERDRHILFTPRLRQLADSLTKGEDNALLKAKHIFKWVNDNFPWASAREYSTIDNIPEYVLANHHGDCGQVTLLFLTLCRISGIPARFESGFMLHPHAENLHDWGELYFEGAGWVPADMSFGIPSYADNEEERYFFLGGIDSWRMVVNSDYGMPLFPEKKFPRSETVDFQRGEVEWDGGNLYFDQWDWHIDVTATEL